MVVLGAGMVGQAMAVDMAKKHAVTVVDIDKSALVKIEAGYNQLITSQLDVREKGKLQDFIREFDLVICAVPGFMGFETLKSVIESQINVVDISFFPESALELDSLAKANSVTAVVDCGVAPGLGNITLGYYNEILQVQKFECLVGGLPKKRIWPFYYKAPFSPVDVIEEYTRPARFVENGKIVVREALSDCEFVEFDNVGTLESFNSDGLRTLIQTMSHIPEMKEKTLRYPGHVDLIKALKHSGFFKKKPINSRGLEFVPREVTSEILFEAWRLAEGEEEITVMRNTIVSNNEKGEEVEVVYNLYDEYDYATKTSSMARTTGYTATAVANLVLDGALNSEGIIPPEFVGKNPYHFNFILKYLEERGIKYVLG